jgi:hypothetical protein
MPESTALLVIDKPQFRVSVHENMLKIDLKASFRNEIEEALENTPILRETVGRILGIFAPLHVRLSDTDSVQMDRAGKVTIKSPRHRDVVIPLEPVDAKRLVDKLNQLIPKARKEELERLMKEHRFQRIAEEEHEAERGALLTSGVFQTPQPLGTFEKEKEAEREIEEEEKEE